VSQPRALVHIPGQDPGSGNVIGRASRQLQAAYGDTAPVTGRTAAEVTAWFRQVLPGQARRGRRLGMAAGQHPAASAVGSARPGRRLKDHSAMIQRQAAEARSSSQAQHGRRILPPLASLTRHLLPRSRAVDHHR
jgi:hypothetical protein